MDVLYENKVILLTQAYFIKDNQDELLLCAHKYDFNILFFDQMREFIDAVEQSSDRMLFVVDLDVLLNMQFELAQQKRQTLFLSDLLQQLPKGRNYIYLQSVRQGERYVLQQRLVDSNCLAYAEKPIPNEILIDKLFNIFAQRKHWSRDKIIYLGAAPLVDIDMLAAAQIELLHCQDPRALHVQVKELQPNLILIEEDSFKQHQALVRVLKKNVEFDPSHEVILLKNARTEIDPLKALDNGFDDILETYDKTLLTRKIINRINKIRTSNDLINRDRATGLLNKIGMRKNTQEWLRHAAQEQVPLAYGVIDIDKFKTINDTWGHYFGDIVIKRLALLLSGMTGERDLLSRFGGEEFVAVFWNCTAEQGRAKLDAMRVAFSQIDFEVNPNESRRFSFSGGIADYPGCKTENELFLQADSMLYKAKQGGRNQIC